MAKTGSLALTDMVDGSDPIISKKNHVAALDSSLCIGSVMIDSETSCSDPLQWARAAAVLQCSHLEEVRGMVKTFTECKEVMLEGMSLTVAHVAAVARRLEVRVVLDIAVAKTRVDKSSNWVLSKIMKGSDIYGVTTGFGATSHRRTQQGVELQKELIRCLVSWFLNLIQLLLHTMAQT